MHLTDIYRRLVSAKITLAEAAMEFGLSPQSLTRRITKQGNRMPLLLLTLDQIVAGAVDRSGAARTLGVTPRQINKHMENWGVQRPLKRYLVDRAVTNLKWDMRIKSSVDYICGFATLENAAVRAGVSTRQIRRWVSDLLEEHHGIVFKDLRRLPDDVRVRIARHIASGEKLDTEMQKLLIKISDGHLSIEHEAMARVLATRKKRRFRE